MALTDIDGSKMLLLLLMLMMLTLLLMMMMAMVSVLQVLRLFHFLVKFGYYGTEDIKALLRPLIAVLDCKHDKPFPQDSDKGNVSCLN